jgi:hypothetical protein
VNVDTGVVSPYYLPLDQGMIMAALGNALAQDMLPEAFVTPEFRRALLRAGLLCAHRAVATGSKGVPAWATVSPCRDRMGPQGGVDRAEQSQYNRAAYHA